MEELCIEGLANHDDREPCVGTREGAGEASVAARAGQAIEPRNHRVRGADAVYGSGRQHCRRRYRESLVGPARSETLCMYGTSMRENREIPGSPVWLITGRAAQGRLRPYA
jgi:RNA-directed DNA polymerase